jgi:MFS family permease
VSTVSRIRALPAITKLLIATNGISAIGSGLVMPFLWIYLTQVRHFSTWVPATTLAFQAAAAILGGLCYGALVDRLPYKWTVPLANVNAGVGTLLYAFASHTWLAIAAAAVFGFGISGVGASVGAAYGSITPAEHRETAYTTDFGVLNLALGAGALIGGGLAAISSLSPVHRYILMYSVDALTFFVMAVATVVALPSGKAKEAAKQEAADQDTSRAGYRAVLRRPELVIILVLLLFTTLATAAQYRSGLPGYLTRGGALTASGISIATGGYILLCAAVQFFLLPLLGKVRRTHLVALSGVLAVFCWCFIGVAGHHSGALALGLACVGTSLLAISEALVFPQLATMLNNAAPEQIRGRANGLFNVTYSLCNIIGPVLAAGTLAWYSGNGFIGVMLVLSAVAAVVAVRLGWRINDTGETTRDAVVELAEQSLTTGLEQSGSPL